MLDALLRAVSGRDARDYALKQKSFNGYADQDEVFLAFGTSEASRDEAIAQAIIKRHVKC